MISRGAGLFLVVQCPGLSLPTLKAQAGHLAGAPRPWQLHGSEEKEERRKKYNQKIKMNIQNPRTNDKSKPTEIKSHKEAYTYTQKEKNKTKQKIYILKKKGREQPNQ